MRCSFLLICCFSSSELCIILVLVQQLQLRSSSPRRRHCSCVQLRCNLRSRCRSVLAKRHFCDRRHVPSFPSRTSVNTWSSTFAMLSEQILASSYENLQPCRSPRLPTDILETRVPFFISFSLLTPVVSCVLRASVHSYFLNLRPTLENIETMLCLSCSHESERKTNTVLPGTTHLD